MKFECGHDVPIRYFANRRPGTYALCTECGTVQIMVGEPTPFEAEVYREEDVKSAEWHKLFLQEMAKGKDSKWYLPELDKDNNNKTK